MGAGSSERALAKDCRRPSIDSVSVADLLGQLLGVGLLGGEQASHRLQLVLHHLELVDQFLLRGFDALGLFDQLLGGLGGAGLQLTRGDDAVELGRGAAIGAPAGDAADAEHDHGQAPQRR